MERAVCLVSGGMDSCVTAAIAHSRGLALCFLHVSYGQRTAKRELRAFHEIADHYSASSRLVTSIEHLRAMGGSALTDPALPVPAGDLEREGIPLSYVPFRNANMLSIATSWAEVLGASSIYIGAVEEDSSGYPDCRRAFFDAFERMIEEGTRPETRISLETPLIHLRKRHIVKRGLELEAPLQLTWSCYEAEDVACGKCDSCLLRLRGFAEAGVKDFLPYRC